MQQANVISECTLNSVSIVNVFILITETMYPILIGFIKLMKNSYCPICKIYCFNKKLKICHRKKWHCLQVEPKSVRFSSEEDRDMEQKLNLYYFGELLLLVEGWVPRIWLFMLIFSVFVCLGSVFLFHLVFLLYLAGVRMWAIVINQSLVIHFVYLRTEIFDKSLSVLFQVLWKLG